MVSTPNAPGGLFEKIEKEPEEYMHLSTFVTRLFRWRWKDIHKGRD